MAANALHHAVTSQILDKIGLSASAVEIYRREGQFQRWLALVAGVSSAMSGVEVGYMHYRGSYSRRIMYTPVILSTFLFGAGVWAFFSRYAAKTVLPAISALTLADSAIGSYFHIRGVQRKPGGWRLPMTNMVMGPPVFAPLLFGIIAYLGIVASFLQADDDLGGMEFPRPAHSRHWAALLSCQQDLIDWKQDLREGRFQKHMAVATAIAAGASGLEAFYSHYKITSVTRPSGRR